eukprot:6200339-Pleurochrysis_carterae.AAC.6
MRARRVCAFGCLRARLRSRVCVHVCERVFVRVFITVLVLLDVTGAALASGAGAAARGGLHKERMVVRVVGFDKVRRVLAVAPGAESAHGLAGRASPERHVAAIAVEMAWATVRATAWEAASAVMWREIRRRWPCSASAPGSSLPSSPEWPGVLRVACGHALALVDRATLTAGWRRPLQGQWRGALPYPHLEHSFERLVLQHALSWELPVP